MLVVQVKKENCGRTVDAMQREEGRKVKDWIQVKWSEGREAMLKEDVKCAAD